MRQYSKLLLLPSQCLSRLRTSRSFQITFLFKSAYFIPFIRRGVGDRSAPKHFPLFLIHGGSGLLKNGLTLKYVLAKIFNLRPTLGVLDICDTYENMAFLTNLSTPWTNGKVLDHEKCFVPNIQLGIFKNYQNFRPLFFYGYMRDGGRSVPPPLAQIELMPHSSIFFLIILGALNIVWLISCCATIFRTAAASSLSLPNFRHPTSQN